METDNYPYYFENISKEEDAVVKSHFLAKCEVRDLVRVRSKETGEHLQTVTTRYRDHHHLLHRLPLRPQDIWIVTYPKCGTTWTQEIVWNVVNGVQISRMSEEFLFDRSPFVDSPMIFKNVEAEEFFDRMEKIPSPRVIKTHYPFELLPPKLLDTCKVVFVCRNVKDACVSYYHHQRLFKGNDFESSFNVFADLFRKDIILQGWVRRDHPNILFFWYEEIKKDQKLWIRKIIDHIGYSLTEEKLEELNEALTFSNYKKTSSMNRVMKPEFKEGRGEFTRKGVVGDWVNHFDRETNSTWNLWIEENLNRIGVKDQEVWELFQTEQ